MNEKIEFLPEAASDLKNRICVVYKIEETDTVMRIIIVSARVNDQVYDETIKRRFNHNL